MFWYCVLFGWILGISTMGMILSPKLLACAPVFWLFSASCIFVHLIELKVVQNRLFRICFYLSFILSCFFIGHFFADKKLDQRINQRIDHISEQTVLVYVNRIDDRSSTQEPVNIKQKVLVMNEGTLNHYEVMLYLKAEPHQVPLKLGEYYRVQGKVKPIHAYAVDGAFDQEKWFIQQNIMGSMQVQYIEQISAHERLALSHSEFAKKQQTWSNKVKLLAEKKRLAFRYFIEQQSLSNKGLLLGLLTGDESLLSRSTQDQFRVLGISHLLAISGPHVLIFAIMICFGLNAFVTALFPKLFLRYPRPYFLLLPFLFCVLLYTAFVGFEIPAMRTCLTVCIVSFLLLFKQQLKALKLLLFSASILLFLDPFSILSAAFWLSYGACFILIRVYQTIMQASDTTTSSSQPKLRTWKSQLWQFLYVLFDSQWKIFIALFPLVAVIFQQVSWIALLVNLIAIPIIGIMVVPFEIIGACLSGWIEPLSILFFHIADFSLSVLLFLLDGLQNVFDPQLRWLALTPSMIALIAVGIFIIFMPKGVLPKGWAIICFFPLAIPHKKSNFELHVLDVGQGQAVFLQMPNQNILIDTGGSFNEDRFSIGNNVLTPFLMKKGVNTLEQVFLTHLDQDHAGAFEYLAKNVEIKKVISNQNDSRFERMKFEYCHEGLSWNFDGIHVQVLSPHEEQLDVVDTNKNEHSCVVYLQVPKANTYQNFLLMGDAGWETEYQLLQKYPDLKVDVLILCHHGSQHSSSFGFLKRLSPKLNIASAGFDNRYGHPSEIVKTRLEALSIPFESTIEEGSIQFKLMENGLMEKTSFRDSKKWLIRE